MKRLYKVVEISRNHPIFNKTHFMIRIYKNTVLKNTSTSILEGKKTDHLDDQTDPKSKKNLTTKILHPPKQNKKQHSQGATSWGWPDPPSRHAARWPAARFGHRPEPRDRWPVGFQGFPFRSKKERAVWLVFLVGFHFRSILTCRQGRLVVHQDLPSQVDMDLLEKITLGWSCDFGILGFSGLWLRSHDLSHYPPENYYGNYMIAKMCKSQLHPRKIKLKNIIYIDFL